MTHLPFDPDKLTTGSIQNHFDHAMQQWHGTNLPAKDSHQYIESRRVFFAGIWFHKMLVLEIGDDPALSDPRTCMPTRLGDAIMGKREKEIQGFVAGIGEGNR